MFKYILIVTCLILSPLLTAKNYTPAKLVEDPNSYTYSNPSGNRIEVWTYLSYIIDEQGNTQHIEIIDISDYDRYQNMTKKHIKNLKFKPASKDGVSIPVAKTYALNYKKSGFSNSGISPGFVSRYDRADNFIIDNNLEEAGELIQEMNEDNVKNLKEQALFHWLRSSYYFAKADWKNYGENIEKINHLYKKLPTKIATKALLNLYQWYIYKNQFASAQEVIYIMQNLDGAAVDEANLAKLQQPIETAFKQVAPFVVNKNLTAERAWLYKPFKSNLSFEFKADNMEKVELRCANSVRELSFSVTISDEDQSCHILFKAKQNLALQITEK